MFPIYVLDGKTELPETGSFYVVTKDGIYLSKDTGLIRAMVKVEKISFLKALESKVQLRLPKIHSETLVQALLLFRRVFQRYRSEAVVMIYYSEDKKSYMLDAPNQDGSGSSVHYYDVQNFSDDGFRLVGTIHSHCDFGAFHSHVDIDDEKKFDGIHITIGRVDQPYFTISSSVAVNNNRFKIEPEELILGITKVEFTPKSEISYRRQYGVQRGGFGGAQNQREGLIARALNNAVDVVLDAVDCYYSYRKRDQFYDLILPEGKDYRSYPLPREWWRRIEQRYVSPVKEKSVSVKQGALKKSIR
ncbi:hypothetical protein ACFL2R_03850 [Patescibacteria group bacterium]